MYGWAGWDHREQGYALDAYICPRPSRGCWNSRPPWLDYWHHEFDANFGSSPAAYFRGDRQMIQGEHGLKDDNLRAWRPVPAMKGAKKKKSAHEDADGPR
ncbi:DUF7008 domain-containing protein [Streptomyces hypolithicus]